MEIFLKFIFRNGDNPMPIWLKTMFITTLQTLILLIPNIVASFSSDEKSYVYGLGLALAAFLEWLKKRLTVNTVANALYTPVPSTLDDLKLKVKEALKK